MEVMQYTCIQKTIKLGPQKKGCYVITNDILKDISEVTFKWFDINNFINTAIDRYKNREGFYSWSGLRYFFYEYERELQPKGEDKKVLWDSFEHNQKNKVSIEHIYPQTPSDDYWTSRFVTKEEQALTHSIGNLLLLSRSKNSEQQNYSFWICCFLVSLLTQKPVERLALRICSSAQK